MTDYIIQAKAEGGSWGLSHWQFDGRPSVFVTREAAIKAMDEHLYRNPGMGITFRVIEQKESRTMGEDNVYLSITFNKFPRNEVEGIIRKLLEFGLERSGMNIYMNLPIEEE